MIEDTMSAPDTSPAGVGSGSPRNDANDIVLMIENLSLYYGDVQALKDVSLEIPRKRVTSFIGPPAGPSTTS